VSEDYENVGGSIALVILIVTLIMVIITLAGCAGMRTYSSNEERCADGCWVQEMTPRGWFWCRLENGEKRCVSAQ
jgi:hypothetical protein